MELTRREALQSVVSRCVPVAAALAVPVAQAAEETPSQPKAPAGMLYDATLCIGCKACVVACAETTSPCRTLRTGPASISLEELFSPAI